MDKPAVENVLNDRERNVRFVFLAYRVMTREEKVERYRLWASTNPQPKRGSTVIIQTSVGIDD